MPVRLSPLGDTRGAFSVGTIGRHCAGDAIDPRGVRVEGGTARERDVGMSRTMRRSGLDGQPRPNITPPLALE